MQECGQDESRVGEVFFARYGDKEREVAITFTIFVEEFHEVKGGVTHGHLWGDRDQHLVKVKRKSVNRFYSQPAREQLKTDIFKHDYC